MSNEQTESQSDVERAEAIATEVADGCVYKRGTDNYARVWQGARLGALRALPRDPQGLVEALRDMVCLVDDMSRFVGSMSLRDYALFNEAPIKSRTALAAWEAGK